MPTILTFGPNIDHIDGLKDQKPHRPRFSMRSLRVIGWLIQIMVLPIATTTWALYGLLLYLLKNTELLEAQRTSAPETENSDHDEDSTRLDRQITFKTLPRVFDSDVELIASSKDGQVIISVGLQNEIVVWHIGSQSHIFIDATDVLLRAASTSSAASEITAVAVDDEGTYCAVGTGAGVIALWAIYEDGVKALPHIASNNSSAAIVDLQFTPPSTSRLNRASLRSESNSPAGPHCIVATYGNAVAAKWLVQNLCTPIFLTPSRQVPVVYSSLMRISPDERLVIAFCMEDGTLELTEVDDVSLLLAPDYCVQAGNPTDPVAKVHVCRALIGGSSRVIVAAATAAGVVSLWDGQTGEFILILDEAYGKINHLCLSPVQRETCHYCGHLPLDSFALTFSVDHIVRFYKVYLTDDTRRCSCTPTRPRKSPSWDNLNHRSRSNSMASTIGANTSPLLSRTRPVLAETSPFPVSGHGVHSRRASEKDTRNRDALSLFLPGEDSDPSHAVGPPDIAKVPTNSTTSFWRKTFAVMTADTMCDRGGWDVVNGKVVGIRRRPRPPSKRPSNIVSFLPTSSLHGLSRATLDRWELWTFDPAATRLQFSALSLLMTNGNENETPSSVPPASHCIPRLPFTRVSPFIISRSLSLAGFGNTLGVFNFLSS